MRNLVALSVVWGLLFCRVAAAQAPPEFLKKWAPSPNTKMVKITFVNRYDKSSGEALLDVPAKMHGPTPLIVSPHAANWTPEMNRSLWTGIADELGVLILHPIHQGKLNPRVSLGSAKQMGNLEAAIEAVEKNYPVDRSRVYAAGISQGAIETLLLAGQHPERFAGALAINPIADFTTFYAEAPTFQELLKADFGGTPEMARKAYEQRSPLHYAKELARVRLTVYWADNDELIPHGEDHQGGLLCTEIRRLHPKRFREFRHSNGHGYPFYRVNPATKMLEIYSRDTFLSSILEMLNSSPANKKEE